MREAIEVEIGVQVPVEPYEQVLVERGGDAERVVVGGHQLRLWLHEVCAKHQPVAGPQRRPDRLEKRHGRRRGEVADVRAKKRHHHDAVGRTNRGDTSEPILVGGLVPPNRQVGKSRQGACREIECGRRDVDQLHPEIGHRACERLDQQRQFLSTAATEHDERDR